MNYKLNWKSGNYYGVGKKHCQMSNSNMYYVINKDQISNKWVWILYNKDELNILPVLVDLKIGFNTEKNATRACEIHNETLNLETDKCFIVEKS